MENDSKSLYSEASKYYVENKSKSGKNDYDRSNAREAKHGKTWDKQKVNLNEIIDEFTPNFRSEENGSKMRFIDDDYQVIADMAAGYLRIYDNNLKSYVKLDGTPGRESETHFKIKKREEM